MRILVSNDDGHLAEGLRVLADALEPLGEITVMAPDRNRSGASNSLTLDSPLRVIETGPRRYCVNGTPSDCVHLAVSGFLQEEPDMVVSGINDGANLGDDVIYSGTVAAAMEGRFLGLPAIAVSLVGASPTHFDTAARVVVSLLKRMQRHPLPSDTILNVNVPDAPWDDLAGFEVARLGFRHRSEPVMRDRDPKDKPIYWIGPAGRGQDAGAGTDFNAVAAGRVAITPLKVDLTHHDRLDDMRNWLADD
ncbi:MAG: 5'/3'-nucleotidase SurE [Gammaproteobacteria bacterium]